MYSFILNKKPYKIPSKCSELTLGQFIEMGKLVNGEDMELLSILMGEQPDLNGDPKKIQHELTNVLNMLSDLNADILLCISSGVLLCQPKKIELMGLTIKIKENFINTLPYWGFIHTQAALQKRAASGKDETFNATDLIPGILAHNFYALVTKSPYNEAKAEEFIDVVNECNFIEAMQVGNFFLLQQKKLWTSRHKRWRIVLNKWKSMLVSRFLINTAHSTRSKHLAAGTYSSTN